MAEPVIDIHYHLNPFVPEWTAPERTRAHWRNMLRSSGVDPDAQLESLLANMDQHGVVKTGLMNPTGDKSFHHQVPNRVFAREVLDRARDRVFGWAGLQILPKPDVDEARRIVEEYGFMGFKFIPAAQWFNPHDFEMMGDLYTYCERNGVPTIWHMGHSSAIHESRSIFGDVRLLNEVAFHYPGLTIILAHAGEDGLEAQAISLAAAFPNVYIEASVRMTYPMCEALPPRAGGDIFQRHKDEWLNPCQPVQPDVLDAWDHVRAEHHHLIRRIANRCPGKFMFATDGPFCTRMDIAVAEYERAFPDKTQRREIFHDTAAKLLEALKGRSTTAPD